MVPVATAVKVKVLPPFMVLLDGVTLTLVTVADGLAGGGEATAFTVTLASPNLVLSTVLVARATVTCCEVVAAGAVTKPVALTVPAPLVLVQVKVCAGELVPVAVAVSCCVAPPATVVFAGLTVTLVTVGVGAGACCACPIVIEYVPSSGTPFL